jgi:hypothetical protein
MGRQQVRCPAGEWTRIISSFASGMPRQFRVSFDGGGAPVEGDFEEKRYWWVFGQTPRAGTLTAEMVFDRYWINAIYRVRVRPLRDTLATIE